MAAEIQIVMPHEALLDPDDPTPGAVGDHGPVPAAILRDILRQTAGQVLWRRLFTTRTPDGRQIVIGLDPRRRRFTGIVADLIDARDRHCRDPYCTASIRHRDHICRWSDGGPTTPENGRGVCERGNQVREMPGWSVHVVDPDSHTVRTTTPTGHSYESRPPEPP